MKEQTISWSSLGLVFLDIVKSTKNKGNIVDFALLAHLSRSSPGALIVYP